MVLVEVAENASVRICGQLRQSGGAEAGVNGIIKLSCTLFHSLDNLLLGVSKPKPFYEILHHLLSELALI